jgi:hypothetical protein
MAVDVDGTLDSKLVADTTQTARQVAGELEQVAKDIGSQLFPRPQ